MRMNANLRMLNRDNAQAVVWGKQAIALAEQFGEIEALVSALNAVGSARLLDGDEGGRADLERSLALSLEHGLDPMAVNAWGNLGSVAGELYEFPLADRYFAEGTTYCAARDLDHSRLYMVAWQALSHLYQGRWTAAGDAASEVQPGRASRRLYRTSTQLAVAREKILAARRSPRAIGPVRAPQRLPHRPRRSCLVSDLDRARYEATAAWHRRAPSAHVAG
jgi:hypothetical protein